MVCRLLHPEMVLNLPIAGDLPRKNKVPLTLPLMSFARDQG